MSDEKVSYKNSGVDIDKANSFIERIKPLIKSSTRKGVIGNIGNFGGLFHLDIEKYKNPVLVAATDGVGTKLRIAQMMGVHTTIGIDLVAMNVNDLIVQGAEPLFFLDYIATGKIDVDKSSDIVAGIVEGCIEAGCALIGGETAEMPGFYADDDYDLAGFCVGVVEYDRIIDGSDIGVGDRIIGLPSNGLHSNGFSLVRKVLFDQGHFSVSDRFDSLSGTLGEELLRPTRIYIKTLLNLIKNFPIRGIAHITGGGLVDNIPRILPERCKAVITRGSWDIPAIFTIIQEQGNVDMNEMARVFNMGIGITIVVDETDAGEVMERLNGMGEPSYLIGTIEERAEKESPVVFL